MVDENSNLNNIDEKENPVPAVTIRDIPKSLFINALSFLAGTLVATLECAVRRLLARYL